MQYISIEYTDLLQNKLTKKKITEAFGPQGLGILIVRNVNGLHNARQKLFEQGRMFAKLEPKIQEKYESPASNYSFGWSRGKEVMTMGKIDTMKGSYYANPLSDDVMLGNQTLIKKYPGYFTPNIWPTILPKFKPSFKSLGQLIYKVALMVLKECDKILPIKFIENLFSNTVSTKGRLLHYYGEETGSESWCGWHLDHGFFTGLVAAQYYNVKTGEVASKPTNGGLKIRSRTGKLISVAIPDDAIAFQIGESAQILSGGFLRATPHFVQKPIMDTPKDRVTLALFLDCPFNTKMVLPEYALPDALETYHLPKGIPLLKKRFCTGETYAKYAEACYQAYSIPHTSLI